MKHILTILAALSLALGTSFAGCGKTETDKGKLKAVNKESKSITIDVAGKEVTVISSVHGDKVESIAKG